MAISEGVHQILFTPWAGRERTTFGFEEGETGSYHEYTWAHGTSPNGLLGILSEDLVRPSSQDLKIEGTEKVQATAVYGSNSVQAPALQMRLQGHAQGACYRCQAGRRQNPRKVGIPRRPSHHKGHCHFRPMSTDTRATNMQRAMQLHAQRPLPVAQTFFARSLTCR